MKTQISLHYAPAQIAINPIAGRAYVLKTFPGELKILDLDICQTVGLIFLTCLAKSIDG